MEYKITGTSTLLREDKSRKIDWSYLYIMHDAFGRVMARLMHGAEKYDKLNFRNCQDFTTYKESAMRHVMQAFNNETDEDHLAAAVVNLLIVMDGERMENLRNLRRKEMEEFRKQLKKCFEDNNGKIR